MLKRIVLKFTLNTFPMNSKNRIKPQSKKEISNARKDVMFVLLESQISFLLSLHKITTVHFLLLALYK